jgi:hypothetical protein
MINCTAVPLLFHVVLTTAKAFIVQCDGFFCSLLVSVRVLCYLLCVTAGSTSRSSLNLWHPKDFAWALAIYDNRSATVGHANLFSERCSGTLCAPFLMQKNPNTHIRYIHFACKFGDEYG